MKLRNTILLLLIAGGLFCYMRFYESGQPGTQEAEDRGRHVVQIDRDKIDGIAIDNNETKIELRKLGVVWEMEAPVKDRADEGAITQLLTSVDTLTKDTAFKEQGGKDDIRDLGLVKPSVTLKLSGSGAPAEILFGKDTAIEGKEYIRVGNSNEIYVVSNELRSQVTKKADDFRSHQLADIPATQVIKINIKTPTGEIELQKEHDHWKINRPISARGDDAKVADLVAQTLSTRVDSFVAADQVAAANTALSEPQGAVTFTAEGSDKPVSLQLSRPLDKDPQKVFGKLSGREALFVLPKAVAAILDTKPNDVRDHHLVRINLDIVDRIHVAAAGAPDILLARKGEEWTLKSLQDRAANGGDVRKMAASLQNQLVAAFVSDVATDLAKYGLDQPRLKVTFSSYASENTAETKAGEQPIESILFGKVEGDNVYARIDDEPFIVSVPKSILDGIHSDPLEWQDLAICKLNPEDITALDVTRDGQATISLIKERGKWKPAKGDIAINGANAQAIASTLATLRAARWSGMVRPEYGIEKPIVTIAFATADKKAGTLKLGAAAGDYWYATATGAEGAFQVNRIDHDTLCASVLPAAKITSPAPSATGTTGS